MEMMNDSKSWWNSDLTIPHSYKYCLIFDGSEGNNYADLFRVLLTINISKILLVGNEAQTMQIPESLQRLNKCNKRSVLLDLVFQAAFWFELEKFPDSLDLWAPFCMTLKIPSPRLYFSTHPGRGSWVGFGGRFRGAWLPRRPEVLDASSWVPEHSNKHC